MFCFIARRKETRFSSRLSDLLGDELSVGLGLLDLQDVQGNRFAGEGFDFLLERFCARATAADDDAGLGGVDVDRDLVGSALDINVGDTGAQRAFP